MSHLTLAEIHEILRQHEIPDEYIADALEHIRRRFGSYPKLVEPSIAIAFRHYIDHHARRLMAVVEALEAEGLIRVDRSRGWYKISLTPETIPAFLNARWEVEPLLFHWRVILTDGFTVDEFYEYELEDDAKAARRHLNEYWEGAPAGWIRAYFDGEMHRA